MNAPIVLVPAGTSLRRLEGLERFTAMGSAWFRSCFNVVAMAEVEGPVTRELLAEAAARVQQRYQCLQVEVVEDSRRPGTFVFQTSSELPRLQTVEATGSDDWREAWHALSHQPLSGLAWRLVWVHRPGTEAHQLLVGCHHAIFDFQSAVLLFSGLLSAMHDVREGKSSLTPMVPVAGALAKLVRSRWPIRGLLRVGWNRYFGGLRGLPLEPSATDVAPEARGWGGVFREMSVEATQSLVSRCRAEGLTVGHVLSAAMLLEAAERVRSIEQRRRFALALLTTMDLRRFESLGVDTEQMGMLVSAVHTYYRPKPTATVWELGRAVKAELALAIARNEHRDFALVHNMLGPTIARSFARTNQGRPPESAFAVSNFGQLDDLGCGPFHARRFFITAAQSMLGATLMLTCGTLRGALSLHLGYPTPSVTDQTAAAVLEGALERVGGRG